MGKVIAEIGRRKWDRANPGGCDHPRCGGPFLVGVTVQARINGKPHPLTFAVKSCKRHTALMVEQMMQHAHVEAEALRSTYQARWPDCDIDVCCEHEEHEPIALDDCPSHAEHKWGVA